MAQKILIIEDELATRKALEDGFKFAGFEVAVAADGEEGLNEVIKARPDIILLDVVMPVMDGVAFLKSLRANSWGKDIPVIVLSNHNDAKKISDTMAKGVYAYLTKADWRLDDIIRKVKEELASR